MRVYIFLLILLGFIPLLDLFQSGLPITHDGQDHIARIANFYKNITEGNIIPRWAANLNWGFGHPILMFLYPLPSYFASLFHFLGFTLVDSVKIVFGVSYLFSGIFMYIWLRNFLPEWGSFTGGLLYMFAPYRFVDLYVRGAIGEHVAFAFPPLILYFLYKLSKKYSHWYLVGGSLSLGGLLLSHNAISLIFLPIIALFSIYLLWQSRFSKILILRTIFIFLLGIGISAFFLLPAFFEGKYTLRDIVTSEDYRMRFVEFKDLIYGVWNYGITGQFSVQIGILHWILTLAAIPLTALLYKKKDKLWILTLGALFTLLLSIFLMHEFSVFIWDKISILQKFQFPWRFLSITVFVTPVLGAIVLSQINKKYKTLVLVSIIFFTLFLNKDYWRASGFLLKSDSFYTGIYNGTTDTGESSPIWSVRFMEQRPKAYLEVIGGDAKITETKRTSANHEYRVEVLERARFKENTLYFPGWNVLIDGKKTDIEFQDQKHRGLITFFVDKGEHIISLSFNETKLRLFADTVSAVSIIILGGITILPKTLRLK